MKPDFAITAIRSANGFTCVEIDTKRATVRGKSWKSLSEYGKRKFENLLVLSRPDDRVKIVYI